MGSQFLFFFLYFAGKWIFSRCTPIEPTPAPESDARQIVPAGPLTEIRKAWDHIIGKRRHRLIGRWCPKRREEVSDLVITSPIFMDSIRIFRRKIDSAGKNQNPAKKKKVAPKKAALNQMINNIQSIDGHMTAEEVERHLKSRQSFMELVPERAPPTVPNEMFSNEPSLDSESNELIETSPSNIGEECLSVEYWSGTEQTWCEEGTWDKLWKGMSL